MFNSQALEVGIGLILCFLLVSLILTATRESVESFMKSRAVDLERAIKELLGDKDGKKVEAFYKHPLIAGLYPERFASTQGKWRGRNSPTYIPRRQFALAYLDLAAAASKEGDPEPTTALACLKRAVGDDDDALRRELEAWYDAAMDRASGWYRRRTQVLLFVMGLAIALLLNVNAVTIAQSLSTNATQRALLVSAVDDLRPGTADALPDSTEIQKRLTEIQLPVGWSAESVRRLKEGYGAGGGASIMFVASLLVGYLVTGLAATLGAPFWFDVLNRFMVIRSTVKPKEKSGDEGSEDRPSQQPSR